MRVDIQENGQATPNFLEIDENWTRREAKEVEAAQISEIWDTWLPKKVTDMHITLTTGEVITDPKEIKWEAAWMDDLDHRIYGILSHVLYKALQTLFFSATGSARISLDGTESKASAMTNGKKK